MALDLGGIQKDIRKLRSFLKRWQKCATPEQVHSLRTTIRRFEAAMQALALDSNANEKRLLCKLAKLRRRAGRVRDLDVLTGYVAGLKTGETGDKEEDCVVQLLEYLGAEHAHRSQRLDSFAVKHGESLRRRLKKTATDLHTLSVDSIARQTAPGHAILSELRLQRELTEPVRLTRNNLHRYRLKVKELRYMLEMENDSADQALIETLGQVKDAIGEWHDWQQLVIIARDHLPHGSKCKLISLLQKTTQKKLKAAIARANAGRQQIRRSPARTNDNA